jgi:hypothetical protein
MKILAHITEKLREKNEKLKNCKLFLEYQIQSIVVSKRFKLNTCN